MRGSSVVVEPVRKLFRSPHSAWYLMCAVKLNYYYSYQATQIHKWPTLTLWYCKNWHIWTPFSCGDTCEDQRRCLTLVLRCLIWLQERQENICWKHHSTDWTDLFQGPCGKATQVTHCFTIFLQSTRFCLWKSSKADNVCSLRRQKTTARDFVKDLPAWAVKFSGDTSAIYWQLFR